MTRPEDCGRRCDCDDLCPFGETKAKWMHEPETASAQEADDRAERECNRW